MMDSDHLNKTQGHSQESGQEAPVMMKTTEMEKRDNGSSNNDASDGQPVSKRSKQMPSSAAIRSERRADTTASFIGATAERGAVATGVPSAGAGPKSGEGCGDDLTTTASFGGTIAAVPNVESSTSTSSKEEPNTNDISQSILKESEWFLAPMTGVKDHTSFCVKTKSDKPVLVVKPGQQLDTDFLQFFGRILRQGAACASTVTPFPSTVNDLIFSYLPDTIKSNEGGYTNNTRSPWRSPFSSKCCARDEVSRLNES